VFIIKLKNIKDGFDWIYGLKLEEKRTRNKNFYQEHKRIPFFTCPFTNTNKMSIYIKKTRAKCNWERENITKLMIYHMVGFYFNTY